MNIWAVILLGGALTYLTRLSFIMLFSGRDIPGWMLRGLKYVPPAVLSAIIFPELFMPGGTLNITFGNLRLISGIVAALVAWRTRNALLTIVVGMVTLFVLQALF
jgi:branched-subunit amino acid transport protein